MNSTRSNGLYRIGRFQFELPSQFTATGRSQSIYFTDVSAIPMHKEGAETFWRDRLDAIRRKKAPPGVGDVIMRTFEFEPGVPAVWYHNNSNLARHLALDVMKRFGDHVLLISREVEAGGEADIEKLVRIVVNAYSPEAERGFFVGVGALSSEPGLNEETRISFAASTPSKIELTFESHTVRRPEKADPLDDVEHDKELFASGGTSLNVIRNEPRVVARLTGREGRLSLQSPDGKGLLRYSWQYPGMEGKAEAPAIQIVASADSEHKAELDACWEILLTSMQRIPFAS